MKRVLAVASAAFLALGGIALAQSQPGMTSGMSGTSPGKSNAGMSGSGQHMSSDQVKQAQNELKQQGLYNGAIDGIVGPQTKSAISQFQKKSGLRQTAQLDQQTLSRLSSGGAGGGSGSSSGSSATPGTSRSSNSMPDQHGSSGASSSGSSGASGMSAPAAPPAR